MTKSRGLRVPKGTRSRWATENQGKHLCGCGCGTVVNVRPEHYPRVPTFLHGHNAAVTHRKALPDRLLCECGCGSFANNGKRFISGHNGRGVPRSEETRRKCSASKLGERNPMHGKKPANFLGRIYHPDGYVQIWTPNHPYACNGRVFEHRLVLEDHLRLTDPASPHLIRLGLRLYLNPAIQVHHIDGIKDNNVVENLMPLSASEHTRLHHEQRRTQLLLCDLRD
jgi:HNH endonuclease/NUMOD3 motif-containing protein